MSFKARLVNTIIFVGMNLVKNFWIIPKWEEMLDEFYPEDSRPKRPSLLKLEKEAGLALQFGNNFIMDGMRPISPNYVMIGMINCRKGKPLPEWIENFVEGIFFLFKNHFYILDLDIYLIFIPNNISLSIVHLFTLFMHLLHMNTK